MNSTPLKAVVTGGTGAIGTEICRALAQTGMQVVALGHPAEASRIPEWERARAAEGLSIGVELADLADAEAATRAMQCAQQRLGTIDVLVNAAGITRDARFTKMTLEQWRAVLASNLDSVFHCCKPVFADMCARGFGRIVNIASVNGQKGQFGQANYSAAKAGMHGFTMALAQEGARYGVTVNTVSPGYVRTPMTAAIKPDVLQTIVAQVPVGRMAEPAEIAHVVAFLCAPESGYVTGANIPVNGGLYMSA
ncbi:acetoacetyl-CoA reductase [Fontimonas sp. SYSU GA230001]|uniref:acetoacetyl-CoA reductase n=1 Tax=Fontimonas sp. SYSU GA230001 TaxID=3142450 RepID=UPI0032B363C9